MFSDLKQEKPILKRAGPLFRHICSIASLRDALYHVRSVGGSAGVDGQRPADFRECPGGDLDSLHRDLCFGAYEPRALRRVCIPKAGGVRIIGVPCVRDRIAGRSVVVTLNELFEPHWDDSNHGYRPGRSVRTAALMVREFISSGASHAVRIDIRAFFDTIDHHRLFTLLGPLVPDRQVNNLIRTMVCNQRWHDEKGLSFAAGLCQGMPTSPVLSNVYLHGFDQHMTSLYGSVRYADDIMILCRSHREAGQALGDAARFLESDLLLACNRDKCDVTPVAAGVEFLGLRFTQDSLRLAAGAGERLIAAVEEITHTASDCDDLARRAIACVTSWASTYCIVEGAEEIHSLAGAIGQRVGARFRVLAQGHPKAYSRYWRRRLHRRLDLEKEHARAREAFVRGWLVI